MIRAFLLFACVLLGAAARGQDIRGHYVSKAETDGVIYHTLPVTLFENPRSGGLTFDLTYKEHTGGRVTLNFTYEAAEPFPADSVRFVSGGVVLSGRVDKIYLEPLRKGWKHRYSLQTAREPVHRFFDANALPRVTVYSRGRTAEYDAKRRVWRAYAPVGNRIFEMIRINEGY